MSTALPSVLLPGVGKGKTGIRQRYCINEKVLMDSRLQNGKSDVTTATERSFENIAISTDIPLFLAFMY